MANDVIIKIVLSGAEMRPGCIRSKEIAEFIESVEDAIASMVISNNPELKKEKSGKPVSNRVSQQHDPA